MIKKNLYIDFDGVILDTMTTINKELNRKQFENEEEKTKFFINYPLENLINDDYIIGDAINDIKKIINCNKFNLAILTHINSTKEATLKINYLRKYFEDITIITCPKEISKSKIISAKNAILVDDYAGNLREWEKEQGISVRFSQKGNGKGFKTIRDLKEIIDMF